MIAMFKRNIWYIIFALALFALYTFIFKPDYLVAGMPKHNSQLNIGDKFNAECTGNETAGRCIDKPPILYEGPLDNYQLPNNQNFYGK